MRPQTKGFLWGLGVGVVGTWIVHAMYPGSRAVGQK